MKFKSYALGRTGAYHGYQVDAYDGDALKFSVRRKLTDSAMTVAKNRGCIYIDEEGLKKLADYTLQDARKIAENKKFTEGQIFEDFFDPCW